MAVGVLRIESDGIAVAGDGFVDLPLASQRSAQVDVSNRELWIESDHPLVAGDRLSQLPLAVQNGA